MKKSFLIFCAVFSAFCLASFGYMNWSHASLDLVYNVDSRFDATITKEKLHKATSVLDIVPEEAEWSKVSFSNMATAVFQNGGEIRESGKDELLNAAQIRLLQSADYSTNICVKGWGKKRNGGPDYLKDLAQEELDFVYYLTVVPEKEAEYAAGYDALISYLKENSKAATAVIRENKLQPGRVHFTVTKTGSIANVTLDSSSGYPSVDDVLIDLITNMSGTWAPATNSQGEKVDQKLVLFFGRQGC